VRHAAARSGVDFDTSAVPGLPQIREVLFLDTPDFRSTTTPSSCGAARCTRTGFPSGEPEIVFKFRHPDLQTAPRPMSGRVFRART
jgi:hypothetical protein